MRDHLTVKFFPAHTHIDASCATKNGTPTGGVSHGSWRSLRSLVTLASLAVVRDTP